MTHFTTEPGRPCKMLLHVFPSFEIGGSQLRFAAIANHYGAHYQHLIVAMNGQTACTDRLNRNGAWELLELRPAKPTMIGAILRARQVLKTLQPDLLITYNWGAIEWAAANILPICRHLHIEDGFGPEESAGRQLRRRVLFRRLVLSHNSKIILPSWTLFDIACKDWLLPRRHLSYLPNGIDCLRFMGKPDPDLSAKLRQRPDQLLIGTVATLRPEKNLGRLIQAFAALPNKDQLRLVIVGDGPERGNLERLARSLRLGDRLVFTGAMSRPEQVLGAFDIFALSSDTEQMPFSILEAMAAGLPIAAVDVGDVAKMVATENRPWVVSPDVASLSQAIARLLQDRPGRQEIGRCNRLHVLRHFDQAMMFRFYGALFDG